MRSQNSFFVANLPAPVVEAMHHRLQLPVIAANTAQLLRVLGFNFDVQVGLDSGKEGVVDAETKH
jgi:hypothetical protein